jgi:hypothetical protein
MMRATEVRQLQLTRRYRASLLVPEMSNGARPAALRGELAELDRARKRRPGRRQEIAAGIAALSPIPARTAG